MKTINFIHFFSSSFPANTDQTSLKLSLTDAVISTIINKRVSYLLDPLTVAVSLAPIQSPSVAGLMCIGVHVDINILQVTIEKEQVCIINNVHVLITGLILPLFSFIQFDILFLFLG